MAEELSAILWCCIYQSLEYELSAIL